MPYKDLDERRRKQKEYSDRYLSDPEKKKKHLERVKQNTIRTRNNARILISNFRANGCVVCGETEHCCLAAHHLIPDKKEFTLGHAIAKGYSEPRILKELEKCICVCHNCHCKIHAGIIVI